MAKRIEKDGDGEEVKAGDRISFSYGIPPVRVEGVLFERDGKLIMPTSGHNPAEATLAMIRRHTGGFWKVQLKCKRPMRPDSRNQEFQTQKSPPTEAGGSLTGGKALADHRFLLLCSVMDQRLGADTPFIIDFNADTAGFAP